MNLQPAQVRPAPAPSGPWTRRVFKIRIGFVSHWLREITGGAVDCESGARVETGFTASVEIEDNQSVSPRRFRVRSRASGSLPSGVDELALLLMGIRHRTAGVADACRNWASFRALPSEARRELEEIFPCVVREAEFAWVGSTVSAFVELRNRVLRAGLSALEARCLCELSRNPDWQPPATVFLPLRLPLLEKRQWSRRAAGMPQCDVEPNGEGVILRPRGEQSAADYDLDYLAAAVLSGGLSGNKPEHGPSLFFTDEQTLTRDQLPLLLQPLLNAYGLCDRGEDIVTRLPADWNRVKVRFHARLDAAAALAWNSTPKERSLAYYAFFAPVAWRVQRCLRLWIPYVRCQRNSLFAKKDDAYAIIVYRSTRPYARSNRPDFAYDPMNRQSVRAACLSARPIVAVKLTAIQCYLAGRRLIEAANLFKPEAAERALARVEFGNRAFLNLLVADNVAVETFRKLGARGREIGLHRKEEPESPVHNLIRGARAVVRAFRTRFKRLSLGEELASLGSLLMLEATGAASEHCGRAAPIRTTVSIENAETGSNGGAILLHGTGRERLHAGDSAEGVSS